MSKYGFDLKMCNTLCYANDMLCRIVDDYKANKIDYDTFLKKRLSVYIHLKNQLQNEIFIDKEVIRKRGE